MKKKPHHSTVFRRKATEQINQLQREIRGHDAANEVLRRQLNELDADKRTLSTKLVALSAKVSATEEARDNLLKTVEEKQQTINRLQATLREIYEEALGTTLHPLHPEADAAPLALCAVKDQMVRFDNLHNELEGAKATISTLEGDVGALKREASVHRDRAAFLEHQLRRRDNTCGKLMAGLVALGAFVIGVAIYNL